MGNASSNAPWNTPWALLALALAGSCLPGSPASATECRDEMDTLQGTLRLTRTRHAMNSSPIEALQLVLRQPICVMYREAVHAKDTQRLHAVRSVHLLVTASEMARLKRRIGASASVHAGRDGGISPALTAWHIGDAIMVHPEIVTIGGKPFR